jgi:hypothetical protein
MLLIEKPLKNLAQGFRTQQALHNLTRRFKTRQKASKRDKKLKRIEKKTASIFHKRTLKVDK